MNSLTPLSNGRRLVYLILVTLTVAGLLTAPASAAGSTAVELTPADSDVDVGNTTTFDVVVASADSGVGAYELVVDVAEADTARITEVHRLGDPGVGSSNISGDGSSAAVESALMDTTETGSVTIARVTIEGTVDGSTAIHLQVDALGDEAGSSYTVTASSGSTLTVGAGEDTPADGSSGSSGSSGSLDGSASTDPPDSTTTVSSAETSTARVGTSLTSSTTAQSDEEQPVTVTPAVTDAGNATNSATSQSDTTGATTGQSSSPATDSSVPGFGPLTTLAVLAATLMGLWVRYSPS